MEFHKAVYFHSHNAPSLPVMEEKQSRVRWDGQELSRLAAVMAPRLLADPELHPLEAVRAAQACLESERRRELIPNCVL